MDRLHRAHGRTLRTVGRLLPREWRNPTGVTSEEVVALARFELKRIVTRRLLHGSSPARRGGAQTRPCKARPRVAPDVTNGPSSPRPCRAGPLHDHPISCICTRILVP